MVKSFDVFDTIIGRKCDRPGCIFDEVEVISKFNNFKLFRKQAEKTSPIKNLDDIYVTFQIITNCTTDTASYLKSLELERELNNFFLIKKNYKLVNNGDILISDTYFTKTQLINFLNHVGFNKTVEIIASYDGKSSGRTWNELRTRKISHIGDNKHSDIAMPAKFGIPSFFFNPNMTDAENFVEKHAKGLGKTMRVLRLSNPYDGDKETYWDQQSGVNFPLLVATSYFLNAICLKKGYSKILFVTRDCVHLQKIYQKLFPKQEAVTFQSSRIMIDSNNKEYKQYVKATCNNTTIMVDLHTTGRRYREMAASLGYPFNFFSLVTTSLKFLAESQYFIKTFPASGRRLEILNNDLIGTMVNYRNGIVIRNPIEYDANIIKSGHECIDLGLKLIENITVQNSKAVMTFLIKQIELLPNIAAISHHDKHKAHIKLW